MISRSRIWSGLSALAVSAWQQGSKRLGDVVIVRGESAMVELGKEIRQECNASRECEVGDHGLHQKEQGIHQCFSGVDHYVRHQQESAIAGALRWIAFIYIYIHISGKDKDSQGMDEAFNIDAMSNQIRFYDKPHPLYTSIYGFIKETGSSGFI